MAIFVSIRHREVEEAEQGHTAGGGGARLGAQESGLCGLCPQPGGVPDSVVCTPCPRTPKPHALSNQLGGLEQTQG